MKYKVIGTFSGKCCDSTEYNNNGMFLNGQLFDILINSEEYQRAMKYRHYIGFLGHPEDPNCMDFEHACIIMTSMEKRPDGSIWGTFDLIDTPVGRIVKAFIDAGVIFGISIRGAGDVDNNGKVDPETFIFRGYDLVTFPAYDDAIPEFKEIAASTDIQKQAKYKKVCATIKTNLSKITSCEALEIIQSQFDNNSSEYQMIDQRISEIEKDEECSGDLAILSEKLNAMTNLYLEAAADNRRLQEENDNLRLSCTRLTAASEKKIRVIDRIMGAQIRDLEKSLTSIENKYKTVVSANAKLKNQNQMYISSCSDLKTKLQAAQDEVRSLRSQNRQLQNISSSEKIKASTRLERTQGRLKQTQLDLDKANDALQRVQASLDKTRSDYKQSQSELDQVNSELESVKGSNLIFKRKVESATQTISDKEQEIADLAAKLRETVTANQQLNLDSSNRDAQIESLQKEIVACNKLIGEYQQAYADMCANAIGVTVEDIPVTATTSPNQLRSYIFGSTASSGIGARPMLVEPEQVEVVDDAYYDDGNLVSL